MKTDTFLAFIHEFYSKGEDLIRRKNKGYGGVDDPFRNFYGATVVGVNPKKAILVRVMDKISRISNLTDNPGNNELQDESLMDSLIDAANYLAIYAAMVASEKSSK